VFVEARAVAGNDKDNDDDDDNENDNVDDRKEK